MLGQDGPVAIPRKDNAAQVDSWSVYANGMEVAYGLNEIGARRWMQRFNG